MSQLQTCDRTGVTGDTFYILCDTCSVGTRIVNCQFMKELVPAKDRGVPRECNSASFSILKTAKLFWPGHWTSPFVCAELLLLPKTGLTACLQVVSHRLNTKQKIEGKVLSTPNN